MVFETAQLKDILVKSNYVSEQDFTDAISYSDRTKKPLLNYFYEREILSPELYNQAVAEFLGLRYLNLSLNKPQKDQVLKIPYDVASELRVVLYNVQDGKIILATDSPNQPGFKEKLLELFPEIEVELYYSSPEDINEVFKYYRTSLNARFNKIIAQEKRVTPVLVEEIIKDAIDFDSSDIHFEPQENEVVIRFRVDGLLQEAGRIEKSLYTNIINSIKVLAKLRIDDHFTAQDGSIRYDLDKKRVDLRVSITPVLDGEKIVIRVLGQYVKGFSLRDIGLSKEDQDAVESVSRSPFGMILATGPTGSGKSTTLYSLLKLLNLPDVNITTIEDPVEYKIEGINQIQVNTQTNLTFAKGLRSIVRQDPDIILVGEIRDEETAEIAVNAALTGHLLLSSFHANDASTAIPRLLDMKIEPFLLASTLKIIVAQRLVRKLCESCRKSTSLTQKDLKKTFPGLEKYVKDEELTVYDAPGCSICNGTGYKGRIAVFEIISNSPEMQDLILKSPSGAQIWELAKSQGARSLFEDGLEKVRKGLTSLNEVLRVAPPK